MGFVRSTDVIIFFPYCLVATMGNKSWPLLTRICFTLGMLTIHPEPRQNGKRNAQEARDQAPASTVGAAAAAAAAESQGGPDGTAVASASSSSSSSTAEPITKKGRTSCDSVEGQEGKGGGSARAAAAAAAAAGEKSAGGGAANTEEQVQAGSGDDDDEAPPGLAIREVEDGVDGVGEDDEEEEDEEEFNPYCFIAHLPPYNTVKHHTPEVG